MPNLETLNLQGCVNLEEVHPSLGHCRMLTSLNLGYCRKLKKLPENIGDLQELQELDATETAISQPPPSITKLGKLRKLSFSHDKQQFQHSPSFGLHQVSALSSLQELHLGNHNIMGGLLEDLGSLHFLKELNVSGSNISCLPKSFNKLSRLYHLNVRFCRNLNELPGELTQNLKELFADYHLTFKSIRDLVICCPKLCRLAISNYRTVSSEQVNVFLQHFCRTCIQCDFHQRAYFVISVPGVKIPEMFNYYRFINQETISIDLNPSWYTDKFMGFWICYVPRESGATLGEWGGTLYVTLVCKSDPDRKYSLEYNIPEYNFYFNREFCCIYIPFETLWNASGNKEGKNPNDYYMLKLSFYDGTDEEQEPCWGIRLEYEKEATTNIGHQRKTRKQ